MKLSYFLGAIANLPHPNPNVSLLPYPICNAVIILLFCYAYYISENIL